jgi:hypothetical protein
MKLDDMPEAMQENILALKHGSATIEADVLQALDEAAILTEFKENVQTAMNELKGEIDSTLELLCQT